VADVSSGDSASPHSKKLKKKKEKVKLQERKVPDLGFIIVYSYT
jgi:hypothetical protein